MTIARPRRTTNMPATCRPCIFLKLAFSLTFCRLRQLADERLCNRGSGGAAVDDLAVSNIFAVEGCVSGLIALSVAPSSRKPAKTPLSLAVEHDLSVRIVMGAFSVGPRGGSIRADGEPICKKL
jgi:hypothetical protein